jgi:hypothetical protein
VFAVLVVLVFQKTIPEGMGLGAFMFLLYIPLGFVTDTMIYRYRQRKKAGTR